MRQEIRKTVIVATRTGYEQRLPLDHGPAQELDWPICACNSPEQEEIDMCIKGTML